MIEIEIGNLIYSVVVALLIGVLLGMGIYNIIDKAHEKKINEL